MKDDGSQPQTPRAEPKRSGGGANAAASDQHLLCLGHGYAASAVAREAAQAGWAVSGTTRSEKGAEAMKAAGVTPFLWEAPDRVPAEALEEATALLVSVKPGETVCPALAGLKAAAGDLGPLHTVLYFSSTGVYGDHDGRWVNEAGPLMPDTQRGRRRLQTEHRWEDFAEDHGLQMLSLRLAGLYGPGRNALESLIAARRGEATHSMAGRRIYKEGQVFSRVHVEDVAGLTARLLQMALDGDWPDEHALNVSDHEPSAPQEVVEYAAELLGIEPPPLEPFEEAELSPMARSFFTDNKRVSGDLARSLTGYDFRYPTYREGLKAICAALPDSARALPRRGAAAGAGSAAGPAPGMSAPANDR